MHICTTQSLHVVSSAHSHAVSSVHSTLSAPFSLQRSLFSYAVSSTQLFNQAVFKAVYTSGSNISHRLINTRSLQDIISPASIISPVINKWWSLHIVDVVNEAIPFKYEKAASGLRNEDAAHKKLGFPDT